MVIFNFPCDDALYFMLSRKKKRDFRITTVEFYREPDKIKQHT